MITVIAMLHVGCISPKQSFNSHCGCFYAGDGVRQAFTLVNDGNVAIRGLNVAQSGILQSVTCQPSLGTTLPVGGVMLCQGLYNLTAADFDEGRTIWAQHLLSSNIVPNSNMSKTFKHRVDLAPVNLTRVASADFRIGGCWHSEWAGESAASYLKCKPVPLC